MFITIRSWTFFKVSAGAAGCSRGSVAQFTACLVAHTQPTHFGLGSRGAARRLGAAKERTKREVLSQRQWAKLAVSDNNNNNNNKKTTHLSFPRRSED